jgi:hypothetical protein
MFQRSKNYNMITHVTLYITHILDTIFQVFRIIPEPDSTPDPAPRPCNINKNYKQYLSGTARLSKDFSKPKLCIQHLVWPLLSKEIMQAKNTLSKD